VQRYVDETELEALQIGNSWLETFLKTYGWKRIQTRGEAGSGKLRMHTVYSQDYCSNLNLIKFTIWMKEVSCGILFPPARMFHPTQAVLDINPLRDESRCPSALTLMVHTSSDRRCALSFSVLSCFCEEPQITTYYYLNFTTAMCIGF
jgi:hypothetical protein